MFNYEFIVKEHHLDTYGHINNATYVALFEEARWEAITTRGYGLEYVQKVKKGPVILELNVRFKKELKLREKVRVTTEVTDYRGKIGRMKQIMWNEDGQNACEADLVMALFDLEARKLIDPTPEWMAAIK